MTRLVTVAHGTRQVAGNEIARTLTLAAGERLAMPAVASYVELCEPLFAEVLSASREPTVVVPLLLSAGFHTRHDLPEAVSGAGGPVVLGPTLGPDPLLAAAQVTRLVEAGAQPGTPVVLVAAGSRDPVSTRDLTRAGELLAEEWGGEVLVSTLTGLGRRPSEVVQPGWAVSPYLLSPGFFADRARSESLAAGAVVVADVIGPHPLVVELIGERTRSLLSRRLTA